MSERQINIMNKVIADIRYYKDQLDSKKPYERTYDLLKTKYRGAMSKLEVLLEFTGEENVAGRAYEIIKSGKFMEIENA